VNVYFGACHSDFFFLSLIVYGVLTHARTHSHLCDGQLVRAGHGRFANLLTGLQSGDEGQQMEAVLELSDFLCMATEESMGGFQVDRFVPAIASLLHLEHNNEIMRTSGPASGEPMCARD
jgi:hypothetical protein